MPKASKREKYAAWAITLRPFNGITDDDIMKCHDRILKMNTIIGYKIITEKKDDERHIHFSLYYTHEQDGSDVRKVWVRLFRDSFDSRHHYGNSQFGRSCVCKSMYNDDWVTKYLEKNDDTVIISDKLPPKAERLKCYKDRVGIKNSGPKGDRFYLKLEQLWLEHRGPIPPQSIHCVNRFLADMMYKKRTINCISNLRRLRSVMHTLFSFIRRSDSIFFFDNGFDDGIFRPP